MSGKKRTANHTPVEAEALFAPIPENNATAEFAKAEQSVDADDAERLRLGLGSSISATITEDGLIEFHSRSNRTSNTNANPTTNTGTGLFGGNNPTTQQSNTSSVFGGGSTVQQPAATSSIFGQNNAQQPATTTPSSMFGQTATQQPTNTTGIFGQNATQQPAGMTSLFGQNSAQQQPATTTSLFGQSTAQQQPAGTTGLFGQNTTQQPASGSGLFGQSTAQQPATTSLFGANAAKRPAPTAGNIFTQSQSATPATTSLFGSTAPTQVQAPSLLPAAMHAQQANVTPFGRLGMSQNNAGQSIGGVKIDLENLRPTTRFEDCIDPIRNQLEAIDKMIQQQESFAKQIEAILPKHAADVVTLDPDVELIGAKVEAVEQALEVDAAGVAIQRNVVAKDRSDLQRCERVVQNLLLPRQFHYNSTPIMSLFAAQQSQGHAPQEVAGDALGGDTDLVNNYFAPLASEMGRIMKGYNDNLAEIEAHMRVIEDSAVERARKLAQRRAGQTRMEGDDTVRELADTLRGFEQSILGVAGVVGECREGINELVVGRYANGRY